jgi:hypothetical protein
VTHPLVIVVGQSLGIFLYFVVSVELKEPIDGLYIAIACNVCGVFFIKCCGHKFSMMLCDR